MLEGQSTGRPPADTTGMSTLAQSAGSTPSSTAAPRLAFVIGAMRSGTTLLRKVLDSHSRIVSPAETWFLLPLLDLWTGTGTADGFKRSQAAAALRSITDETTFRRACRAFAETIYEQVRTGVAADVFIDKTPPYLAIAPELAETFPDARFIVLARDPRGTLHSRATWRHATKRDPAAHVNGVVRDTRQLASFVESTGDRACLVRYEDLCTDPDSIGRAITSFLGLPYEPAMVTYGDHAHVEGYGDENAAASRAPHRDSIDRWRRGVPATVQQDLLDRCGGELETLGYRDLAVDGPEAVAAPPAAMAGEASAPSSTAGAARDRRVLFFMSPGTNSRDHLEDMVNGYERAGARVTRWDVAPIVERLGTPDAMTTLTESTRLLAAYLKANDIELTVGIWAFALGVTLSEKRGDNAVSFFDAIDMPHLMFWFDAPERAHGGGFREQFNTPIVGGSATIHQINNRAAAQEMAGLWGFTNVLPLPYGVNEETFRPCNVEPKYDLVFCMGQDNLQPTDVERSELGSDDPDVGAIVAARAALACERWPKLAEAMPGIDPDAVRALVERLVARQAANRHEPFLERLQAIAHADVSLLPAIEFLIRNPDAYANAASMTRGVERWRRPFFITWLSRRFSCAVYGAEGLEAWDSPAERLGYVEHQDQSRCYGLGRAGLNVMRWQDEVGINIKPFEIAASGRPVLCEQRTSVDECFVPGEEINLFDTPADAGRALSALLDDPAARRNVADAALARVHRDHTWRVRADQVLSVVPERS